jgi:hypothetical protein
MNNNQNTNIPIGNNIGHNTQNQFHSMIFVNFKKTNNTVRANKNSVSNLNIIIFIFNC